MLLILSHAACEHIVYLCNERAWRDTGLLAPLESEDMRLKFIAATFERADPLMFELTRVQLRALDMLLTDSDPREGKLPDGTSILALVETVWKLLIGESDGRDHDHDYDLVSDADNGTTVG